MADRAIPVVRIPVGVFRGGDPDLVWWGGGDGKPRCTKHRGTALVRLSSVGVGTTPYDYVCHLCWRAVRDHKSADSATPSNPPPETAQPTQSKCR